MKRIGAGFFEARVNNKDLLPILSKHNSLEEVAQVYAGGPHDVVVTRKQGKALSRAESEELNFHWSEWELGAEE